MAHSKRLQEVLDDPNGILAGVSGNKASNRLAARLEADLSAATILRIKEGKYGEEANVRLVGRAYAEEILAKHRADIIRDVGAPEADSKESWEAQAEQWLAFCANPRFANVAPVAAGAALDPEAVAVRAAKLAIQEESRSYHALNAADALLTGVKELQDAHPHLYIPLPSRKGGLAELTMQDVEEDLRDYREGIKSGVFKPRPTAAGQGEED